MTKSKLIARRRRSGYTMKEKETTEMGKKNVWQFEK